MRPLTCLFLLAACVFVAPAAGGSIVRAPVEDLGVPYWCDWGYDWDERCYRDNTARLPVGGVDDKVWRAALRFSLEGVPESAEITSARLDLYFDGACVAPRRRVGPCLSPQYTVDAHPILSASGGKERELDFDPVAVASTTVTTTSPGWHSWDVTPLVADWVSGAVANCGLLLALAEEEEDYGVSGPYFPSSSSLATGFRPRLAITYAATTGPAP